jgi:hypothetical protein
VFTVHCSHSTTHHSLLTTHHPPNSILFHDGQLSQSLLVFAKKPLDERGLVTLL